MNIIGLMEKTNIGLVFLAPNLKKAPFSDEEFREALSYAINYEELAKLETLGYGEVPNRGFVPPSMTLDLCKGLQTELP